MGGQVSPVLEGCEELGIDAIDTEDSLAIDSRVFQSGENALLVFARSATSSRPLNRAVLSMDGPIVVQPVKENVGDLLAVVVRTALDVREERIEVNEGGGI